MAKMYCNEISVSYVMNLMNTMAKKGRTKFNLKKEDMSEFSIATLECLGCRVKTNAYKTLVYLPKNFAGFKNGAIWNQERLEKLDLA